MSVAVEAKNLVKDFGSVRALDGLNFKINEGEIFGLIGLNGAGKQPPSESHPHYCGLLRAL